jgi:hypothetical protein
VSESFFVGEVKGVVESGGEVDYHVEVGGILCGRKKIAQSWRKGDLKRKEDII